ncbi:MAG TPA: hypothetical protein VHS78_02725 [Candidatus Elarobacter sp.]|jgi:hypothetical protein|nr:hypothetical protein [Candidatus Elarobacter sp.]
MMLAVLMAALLGAATFAPSSHRARVAAAPLDAPHAAVLSVISTGDDAAGCDAAQKRALAASASIRKLGRIGGADVVLAEVYGSCICGAQNCPYYAIRLTARKPRVLLSTFGINVRIAGRATPLPEIVVLAHDSAMVADEMTYAYRDGVYTGIANARVRASDRARKTDIPVRFPAGASSAALHGTVSTGWYDLYTFDAAKGQRLAIDGIRSRAKLTLTLFGPESTEPVTVRPGVAMLLPRSGTYRLQIDDDSENGVPYAMTLAIR